VLSRDEHHPGEDRRGGPARRNRRAHRDGGRERRNAGAEQREGEPLQPDVGQVGDLRHALLAHTRAEPVQPREKRQDLVRHPDHEETQPPEHAEDAVRGEMPRVGAGHHDEPEARRDGDGGWLFQGRGWGHGVGMCQAGAFGMARRHLGYREILQHYYSGVELGLVREVTPVYHALGP